MDLIFLMQIIASIATVISVLILARQMRYMKKAIEVEAFLQLFNKANDDIFKECRDYVKYELKASQPFIDVYNDKESWKKISQVIYFFEMIGTLIVTNHISKLLICEQMGPWITSTWEKLKLFVYSYREETVDHSYGENFEKLAMIISKKKI